MYTVFKLTVTHVIYGSNIQEQHKKTKATRHSARDLKKLLTLLENSAEGLRSKRDSDAGIPKT